MKFTLRIPGRDGIEPTPAANSANPLILAGVQCGAAEPAANDEASVAADQAPISGLAGLAALATCESEHEDTVERSATNRARQPELVALLTGAEARPPASTTTLSSVSTCTDCQHLLRRGTCAEPVAAGLLTAAEGFGIVWPAQDYGAACAAFALRKGLS